MNVAWIVKDSDHGLQVAFYPENANELDPDLFDFDIVERIKIFDRFAYLGHVPPIIFVSGIAKNYWFPVPCDECEVEICEDFWDIENEVELDPIFAGSTHAFCCKQCLQDWEERRKKKCN